MLGKSTSGVMIDMLFNLLITFVALFFLSFILVNDPKEKEDGNIDTDAIFVITMTWDKDVDIDLWVKQPDLPAVFYGRREVGPAHLDLDVVKWRQFHDKNSDVTHQIRPNQEVLTIRGYAVEGTHIVNAHYFGGHGFDTPVQISVYNARSRRVVWAGTKVLTGVGTEAHFVKFDVYNDRVWRGKHLPGGAPEYFVGRKQ